MKCRNAIICAAAGAVFFGAAVSANAQVGSTTDIIMGRVIGPDSQPVANAKVQVTSAETGITRTKTTGADGRYSVLFPDGGGSYHLTVIAVGKTPVRKDVSRSGDEDRIITDVQMGVVAAQLSAVQVRASRTPRQGERPEPGSTERGLNPNLVNRLPIDATDLNNLATLAPGVVGVPGTDSTKAAFSVAGQPSNQNSITLDGLSFGSGSVPQEAVRNTRVITNTYDVARGQFTGGQVASTTRGGTNNFQGAFSYSWRNPTLEFFNDPSAAATQEYTQNQLSGGAGGPIIRDKMFIYGALSFQRRTDPLLSLLASDPLTLSRLGTNQDSVERFKNLVQQFGLPLTSPLTPEQRQNDNTSAIVRFDYNLAESHTLMIRGDWRGNTQLGSRLNALALPNNGGTAHGSGGGAMATLTSNFGSFINELRGYKSLDKRNTAPYLSIPDGRVVVASTLADGSSSISSLQFGGNPSLPQVTRTDLLEASDEISRVTGGGSHRFKLGALVNQQKSTVGFVPNQEGTFLFNSLADFEAGHPIQFTRTLTAQRTQSATDNFNLYLGDSWRFNPDFQITYGLRAEGSRYPDAPAYNPAVEQSFGRRTDKLPSETHVSPRAGFTWFIGPREMGPPPLTVRGGFGEFRGTAPSQLFSNAINATGLSNGESQLICVGSTVPVPNWASYLSDPSTIPTSCNGPSSVFATQRRNVTVFDPSFEAPRAWRSTLGLSRRFWERYTFSIDAAYARGIRQTGALDLNLDTIPEFRLAGEQNRPVYVAPSSIVPATGALSNAGSRRDPAFGIVNQVSSTLRSDTKQLTFTLGGFTRKGIQLNTSYTFTVGRDQSQGFSTGVGGGFGGGIGTTAGNPNTAEWGTGDNARRHTLLGTITYPIKPGFELSAIARAVSGNYYAPQVSGDINGDGRSNDRAFVFNPSTTSDTAIANGMNRMLANTSARARQCILAQLGSIASRNSCQSQWTPSLDLQANFKPTAFGKDRPLTISLIAQNALTGLDQLLHGNNLRGWGQPVVPDRTLLYVRGFDPATNSFKYQVNEHFGVGNGSRNAFRIPFQLALQGRLTLGTDPARAQFNAVMGGGRGATSADALKARMTRLVPNTFEEILALNDSLSLQLTPDQISRLHTAGDRFKVQSDSIVDKIAGILASAGSNADPRTMFGKIQSPQQDARKLTAQSLKDAQAILTPDQWKKLPDRVKTPFQRRDGEGGGFRGGA